MTDEQWERTYPLIPFNECGRPHKWSLRLIIELIIKRFDTNSTWRALETGSVPWPTVYCQYRMWKRAGVLTKILEAARS